MVLEDEVISQVDVGPAQEARLEENNSPQDQDRDISDVAPKWPGNGTEHLSDSQDKPTVRWVRMRVSSRHLMLASRVFNRLLQRGFAEGDSFRSTAHLDLDLPDDDPQGLQIVLDIIHGRVKRVPRTVGIESLTGICILIDKYDLHEVTGIFTELLLEKLDWERLRSFTKDLMMWMCVSWILDAREILRHTTRIAMQESRSHLASAMEIELPTPQDIFDRIEEARQFALNECFSQVGRIQDLYQGPEQQCKRHQDCDAMVLGTLLTGLQKADLLPLPARPFTNLSFQIVDSKLRTTHIQPLCETLHRQEIVVYRDCDYHNWHGGGNREQIDHFLGNVGGFLDAFAEHIES